MKMNFDQLSCSPILVIFEDPHILTIGTLREDGFRIECVLPRKHGFFRMYGSDAGQPHIQRGYCPFVMTRRCFHDPCCPYLHTCTNHRDSTELPVPTYVISTPSHLRPLTFAQILMHHLLIQYVSTLLSHGFNIGYQGPHRDLCMPNFPSSADHPDLPQTQMCHGQTFL